MSYPEKYELAKKPFLKKFDLMRILGTNTTYLSPFWNEMIKTLESQTGHSFGPWGVPKKMCLDYFGIDIEDLRINAEAEKKVDA